jgi:hypothetical protein
MTEITNEERARILAMYWGSPCVFWFGKRERTGTIGVMSIQRTLNIEKYKCQLTLHDLADITDDDAIEVAKIIGYKEQERKSLDVDACQYDSESKSFHIALTNWPAVTFHLDEIGIEAVNFLRKKSYDVDGLIIKGIAIKSK